MGLIERVVSLVFGGGAVGLRDTVEVFRENAERSAQREHAAQAAALGQFAAEFEHPRKSFFDQLIDALNRVPRPAMALGTLGLFVAAMVDPIWFASRMEGIALVPEPLWWLLGAIVSFYFGARHQLKGQEFQRSLVQSAAAARSLAARRETAEDSPPDTNGHATSPDTSDPQPIIVERSDNAALDDWRKSQVG